MRSRTFIIFGLIGAMSLIAVIVILKSPATEFIRWQVDLLCGYKRAQPTEHLDGYDITLVQEAGMDFYDTYFEIKTPEGKITRLLVDGDDHRWKNPRRQTEGDRIYYIDGKGDITKQTSYIDTRQKIVYAGYLMRTLFLTSLDASKDYQ